MRRQIPPLNSLIAAEAAARLESFKAASEELHVTPSAVSHQIRALEEWLGFSLFDRSIRSIKLTESGSRYLTKMSEIFDDLEEATREEFRRRGKSEVLRLQTTDSFANRWLVSRLPDFSNAKPEVDVRVSTFEFTEGFKSDEVDMAILYGDGSWPKYASMLVLKETIFPVCSPGFMKAFQSEGLTGLLNGTLIHDYNLGTSWRDWCDFAVDEIGTIDHAKLSIGPTFNHSHLAIKAAELGSGIALASLPLVSDSIDKGLLVAPFSSRIPTEKGYHLVEHERAKSCNDCQSFILWLQTQCDETLSQ